MGTVKSITKRAASKLTRLPAPSGMTGFSIVWLGQMVSVMATNMTGFALTIWVYQKTGSATALGLMQVCFITPFLLISPIAGVMIDRYNRKLMMMVSDLGAGLATVAILALQATGRLELWHLYVAMVIEGLGNTFQWPAYSAAISTMVPKEQYGRANGMMGLIEAGPGVIAPILAGALLPFIGLSGVLSIDVATFILAILALLVVYIPQPPRTVEGQAGQGNIWEESAYGFKYIFARPGLLGLQLIFFFGNLFSGVTFTLVAPMVLSRTSFDSVALGTVLSFSAAAAVAGGIIMSVWGGLQTPGAWRVVGLDRVKPVHDVVWFRSRSGFLDPGGHALYDFHPAYQCLKSGCLAGQGRSGCSGASLFGAALDRLAHQPGFANHRWYPGGFRA